MDQYLPFPANTFTFTAGNRTLNLTMPADQDGVLDSISDEQYDKDKFLPYWTEQWPSAIPLCNYLVRQDFSEELLICELGCGLGVISALLASQGLFTVATDIALPGCHFTARNISGNGGVPRVICADWRHPPFRRRFDVVIASDVLYEERWIDPVLGCLKSILAPDGYALIADPCRRFWLPFKNDIHRHGLKYETVAEDLVEAGKIRVEVIKVWTGS